jgi:hypothetical protein
VHAGHGPWRDHDASGHRSGNTGSATGDDAEFAGDSGNDRAWHVESSGDPESIAV